jgi:hypothetical protein
VTRFKITEYANLPPGQTPETAGSVASIHLASSQISPLLYKHHKLSVLNMILAVLEQIIGFAGVFVLSVLCLHHGRYISSQVCCVV